MNPEDSESVNCPAEVFSNRECTKPVGEEHKVGFMVWGRRVTVVIKLDGLWVPLNCSHHPLRSRDVAARYACAA
jgi:hypothetical protein